MSPVSVARVKLLGDFAAVDPGNSLRCSGDKTGSIAKKPTAQGLRPTTR